jgi:hypothetical protein
MGQVVSCLQQYITLKVYTDGNVGRGVEHATRVLASLNTANEKR